MLSCAFEFGVCDAAVFVDLAERVLDVCDVHGELSWAETGEVEAEALKVVVLRVDEVPHHLLVKGQIRVAGLPGLSEQLAQAGDGSWTGDYEVVSMEIENVGVGQVEDQLVGGEGAEARKRIQVLVDVGHIRCDEKPGV